MFSQSFPSIFIEHLHDAAMLMFQHNETAAMLVYQGNYGSWTIQVLMIQNTRSMPSEWKRSKLNHHENSCVINAVFYFFFSLTRKSPITCVKQENRRFLMLEFFEEKNVQYVTKKLRFP